MKANTWRTAFVSWALLMVPSVTSAQVTLPWSTTYDCPDWTQSDGLGAIGCDGLSGNGGWTCDNGDGTFEEEQVTVLANHAAGLGGKGQRSWDGDGVNNNSGSTRLDFDRAHAELWVRWYMRYPLGLRWDPSLNYEKWLRFDVVSAIPIWQGQDGVAVVTYPAGRGFGTTDFNHGWNQVMVTGPIDPVTGFHTGDGLWHLYEVHLVANTAGSADGLGEIWIDGVRFLSRNDIEYRNPAGWSGMTIAANQRVAANGRCLPVDYDDVVVRTTGPIGPIPGIADAGMPDTGTADAGMPDAGSPMDAGTADAGSPMDAGTADAGSPMDAGASDAGSADSGALAGDASAAVDSGAGVDAAGSDSGPATLPGDGGCCSVAPGTGPGSGSPIGIALLVGLVAVRRLTRRRR